MMKLIFLLLLVSYSIQSQTIPNSEFIWDRPTHNVCRSEATGENIYLNPKFDPIITQISKKEFTKLMVESISKLDDSISCVVKLYIVFEKSYPLRVDRIGTKGSKLNNDQLEIFKQTIQSITAYKLGSTLGPEQNTLGIIYAHINKGKLSKMKYINIDFLH